MRKMLGLGVTRAKDHRIWVLDLKTQHFEHAVEGEDLVGKVPEFAGGFAVGGVDAVGERNGGEDVADAEAEAHVFKGAG